MLMIIDSLSLSSLMFSELTTGSELCEKKQYYQQSILNKESTDKIQKRSVDILL